MKKKKEISSGQKYCLKTYLVLTHSLYFLIKLTISLLKTHLCISHFYSSLYISLSFHHKPLSLFAKTFSKNVIFLAQKNTIQKLSKHPPDFHLPIQFFADSLSLCFA